MSRTRSPSGAYRPTLGSHLAFTLSCGLVFLAMYTLLRGALLVYNRELIGATPAATFVEAFFNGLRFDLRLTIYALAPLLLSIPFATAMAARRTACGSPVSPASPCSSACWSWTSTASSTNA